MAKHYCGEVDVCLQYIKAQHEYGGIFDCDLLTGFFLTFVYWLNCTINKHTLIIV